MKSILLSIKPEWVAKILNGEKTIEVRKKFPKDYVGWVYVYCTKGHETKHIKYVSPIHEWLGKVVARFWCDKVKYLVEDKFHEYYTEELEENEILKKSCLTYSQLFNYLKGKVGYAIHISKLEIFDRPKELNEFYNNDFEKIRFQTMRVSELQKYKLTKAPQNYCFIEGEEYDK